MRSNVLQEMTWPDFEEYLETETFPVAIIPVGSTEQHALHLPLGTDWFISYAGAKQLAEITNAILVPITFVGISPHHMHFKGTITLKSETLVNILLDTIESLVTHGIQRIVIANYHGGNWSIVLYAANQAQYLFDVKILVIKSVPPVSRLSFFRRDKLLKEGYDFHAGPLETSSLYLVKPELVQLNRARKPNLKWSKRAQEILNEMNKADAAQLNDLMTILHNNYKWLEEVTDTGALSPSDPMKIFPEEMREIIDDYLKKQADLINNWRTL